MSMAISLGVAHRYPETVSIGHKTNGESSYRCAGGAQPELAHGFHARYPRGWHQNSLLTIVDTLSRESLALEVDYGLKIAASC